jgi:hypothetical protein
VIEGAFALRDLDDRASYGFCTEIVISSDVPVSAGNTEGVATTGSNIRPWQLWHTRAASDGLVVVPLVRERESLDIGEGLRRGALARGLSSLDYDV